MLSGAVGSEVQVRGKFFSPSEPILPGFTYVDYYQSAETISFNSYKVTLPSKLEYNSLKFSFKWMELKQTSTNLMGSCMTIDNLTIQDFWFANFKPTLEKEKVDTDSQVNKQYSLILSKKTAEQMFNQVTEYNLAVSAQSEVGFFKVFVEVHHSFISPV